MGKMVIMATTAVLLVALVLGGRTVEKYLFVGDYFRVEKFSDSGTTCYVVWQSSALDAKLVRGISCVK